MLQTGKIVSVIFNDNNYEDKVELNLGDYEIIEEHGKTYAVKKKKEYPKTFEECVHVLEGENRMSLEQMNTFRKLIDARNAYWKIAGEEMGLGKPWAPDWKNQELPKYCIAGVEGQIKTAERYIVNTILAFPTAEMRDSFHENFKELIEICKELL